MKSSSRHYLKLFSLSFLLLFVLAACGEAQTTGSTGTPTPSPPITVNLGYFPNITHAIALVGVANKTFEKAFGANTLKVTTFNAGPNLIEALQAGSIDIGYVGPNPAINGYVTGHGQTLRIIAGASSGGALFIVRPGANIKSAADLAGKKLATPQKGGTQDISLRYYLQKHNLKSTDDGGSVQILPADNSVILNEFKQGQIDGAWVPEPWASRLVQEGKGTVFVDERTLWPNNKFVTTNVVVRKAFLDQHPDVVAEFLKAHVETVQYINKNLPDAEKLVNDQLQTLTGKPLAQSVLDQSFKDLDITYDPLAKSLFTSANNAFSLGFLGDSKPDLSHIYDLDPLNKILKDKGLATVAAS
ncbi:ABC transporter substrate-binding protein [Tengunoibacter tsumagoiensis]|uniref:Lipoprotein n=1 Tax=Tengunoibacter tsumagoiensis TaxID=2014871 RepID=A0A402A1R2_9CHLR|nr:ABC transporter substrate-binding protein [Tengunoibacter tsumagoiensis]GCE12996.1 lipoprotein [Tengunoibacter tsumagoiensis]